jgi:hypothetical protein
MSRTTLYRISLVLTLAAVLSLAPRPTWAGTRHPSRPQATQAQSAASLLGQAWNHLVSIFGRAGSIIDPNGSSVAAVHNSTPDATIRSN